MKESTKKWVLEVCPRINVDEPMSTMQWSVVNQKWNKKCKNSRLDIAERFNSGDAITNGKISGILSTVSKSGHLHLKGRRGAFHPRGWELVS
jgi:hypothetical protein